jgi:hypothetical protein
LKGRFLAIILSSASIQDKEQLAKTRSSNYMNCVVNPKKDDIWKIEVLNTITEAYPNPTTKIIEGGDDYMDKTERKPITNCMKPSRLDARNYARTRSLVDQRKPPLPCSHGHQDGRMATH